MLLENCSIPRPVVILLILVSYMSFLSNATAQTELPTVTPPSPDAMSFQRISFENFNSYTGSASISVPLANVQVGPINVPVSLSYVGSHGIKVEEVASEVGLGWSLNAGGMVSRTIRGMPDEQTNYGWLDGDPLPTEMDVSQVDLFEDIATGQNDGEADLYSYSAPGISGSFLMPKSGGISQVPMSSNEINPSARSISSPIHGNESNNWNEFQSFEVISPEGLIYTFSKKEELHSHTYGTATSVSKFKISSWHLTQISDYNSDHIVYFEYDWQNGDDTNTAYQVSYSQSPEKNITPIGVSFGVPRYSVTKVHKPVLKRIYDNHGVNTILFVRDTIPRCDRGGTYALNEVQVYKYGRRVARHQFIYSYFDRNGIVSYSDPCTSRSDFNGAEDGDMYLRLKLDEVKSFNDTDTDHQSHLFTYNTSYYLPSRYSYVRDHWGFYNGEEDNPSLFPKQYLDLSGFQGVEGTHFFIGDANRGVSTDHAKAAVLTRITYPTGGNTQLIYESNEAAQHGLVGDMIDESVTIADGSSGSISISLVTIPMTEVTISSPESFEVGKNCDLKVTFQNVATQNSTVVGFDGSAYNTTGRYINKFRLEAGDYTVTVNKFDGVGDCFDSTGYYPVNVIWGNEVPSNKVGGLRLNSIKNCDGSDCLTKAFDYIREDGGISGYLLTKPRYGFAELDSLNDIGLVGIYPITWHKSYSTNLPLTATSGNVVGYDRVVERQISGGESLGYTVKNYISPFDIKEEEMAFANSRYDAWIQPVWGGYEYPTMPPAPIVNRDWARGKLKKTEHYNDSDLVIQEDEYFYKLFIQTKGSYGIQLDHQDIINPSQFSSDSDFEFFESVLGVVTQGAEGIPMAFAKFYDFPTGKIQQVGTSFVKYDANGDGQTTASSTIYADVVQLDDFVRTSETSNSKGETVSTSYKYTFDNVFGSGDSRQTVLEDLDDLNVKIPVESKSYVAGALNETTQSVYDDFGSDTYLQSVNKAFDGNLFRTTGVVNDYDDDGQPLSVSTMDGMTTLYQWADFGLVNAVATSPVDALLVYYDYEGDAGNNSNQSWSGEKSFSTGGSVTYSHAVGSDMICSYWYLSGGEWVFSGPIAYTGSITITQSTIDDFIICHKDAQVSTNSYDKGQVTSKSGPNGIPTYYEYDGFGRLALIRDHEGNIIQQYEYHYKD